MFLDGAPVRADDIGALGLVNYGHFTSMLVRQGCVRGLDPHLDRLVRDCRILFDVDLGRERIRELARQAVGSASGPIVVRVTVFDPALELGRPGADASPRILVTTRAGSDHPSPPATLRTVAYERDMPEVKGTGLFATIRHRRVAQRQGFDDVLFTDAAGWVSEGATSNIGFVSGDRVIWPALPCLRGVTMGLIDRLHPGTVANVNIAELTRFDAVFLTNAGFGVRAVRSIDSTEWDESNPLVDLLIQRYHDSPGEPL